MTDKKKLESAIERLADQVGKTDGPLQDMQLSQAALNLAHTLEVLRVVENSTRPPNDSGNL